MVECQWRWDRSTEPGKEDMFSGSLSRYSFLCNTSFRINAQHHLKEADNDKEYKEHKNIKNLILLFMQHFFPYKCTPHTMIKNTEQISTVTFEVYKHE